MSRYYDKDGNEVICSRAEYIAEMERRAVAVKAADYEKPARKPKKAAKKGAK